MIALPTSGLTVPFSILFSKLCVRPANPVAADGRLAGRSPAESDGMHKAWGQEGEDADTSAAADEAPGV